MAYSLNLLTDVQLGGVEVDQLPGKPENWLLCRDRVALSADRSQSTPEPRRGQCGVPGALQREGEQRLRPKPRRRLGWTWALRAMNCGGMVRLTCRHAHRDGPGNANEGASDEQQPT